MDNNNININAISETLDDVHDANGEKLSSSSAEENREVKKRKHENHNNISSSVEFVELNDDDQDSPKNCECEKVAEAKNAADKSLSFDADCATSLDNSSPLVNDLTTCSSVDVELDEQLEEIGQDLDVVDESTLKFNNYKRKLRAKPSTDDDFKRVSHETLLNVDASNDEGTTEQAQNENASSDDGGGGTGQMEESSEDISSTSANVDASSSTSTLVGKHSWYSYKAIKKREYGWPNCRSPDWFRYKAIGSLHMVQRLELMYKMENHEGCVNCLHFNATGTRLASGSDDLNVCLWDWSIKKPVITFSTGHRGNVFQAKFMPLSGDCHIVTCARDGQVRLAELSVQGVCKNTRKLAQHRGSAHKLALELDSPHVFLTCGEDGLVYEIDLRDPKPNKLLVCKEGTDRDKTVPLYSIHSHPRNPYYFAVSGRDQFSRIYDKRRINDATPVKKFCPEHLVTENSSSKANITCLVYNYDGSELLASYNDDDIFLFDVDSTSENSDHVIHRYTGHRNNATVKGVNFFGSNSEYVISGSDCGYIYFWDRQTEEIVQFLPGDEQGVINVLEPHPTASFLATSGLDHDVKIWVPSNEDPKYDKKLLSKLVKRNARDREVDRRRDSDMIDSHMLYLLLSRMRRNNRRRRSQSGEQAEDHDGEDGSGEPSDDSAPNTDTDEEGDGPPVIQCRTS